VEADFELVAADPPPVAEGDCEVAAAAADVADLRPPPAALEVAPSETGPDADDTRPPSADADEAPSETRPGADDAAAAVLALLAALTFFFFETRDDIIWRSISSIAQLSSSILAVCYSDHIKHGIRTKKNNEYIEFFMPLSFIGNLSDHFS
jgi:hypothetical protein